MRYYLNLEGTHLVSLKLISEKVQNTKKSILIMGMPLTGKTTIGKILAKRLKISFYDLDKLIEQKHGDSVYNLINKKGEDEFRNIESGYLKNFSTTDSHVLSLGGGTVNSMNIDVICSYSIRIWLKSNLQTLIRRLTKDEIKYRPLIDSTNLMESLNNIYISRKENYNKCSNHAISINNKSTDMIISELTNVINERN